MNSRFAKLLALAAIVPLAGQPLAAQASDSGYRTISDVLAAGLPLVAAGLSLAQDDTAGLYQLVKAEATSIAVSEVLKQTVHETRPNGRDEKSFPSGHAAVAFSAAQFMWMKGGMEIGLPAYVAASVVAYSRVRADEHYWRDVGAGALIGIASSQFFTDSNERTRWRFAATPSGAYAQVSTSW